jgi:hypothetical protein
MKRLFLLSVWGLLSKGLFAQLYNGGDLYVQNGGLLYLEGNLTNTTTASFRNLGTVIIKGDITNDALVIATAGSKLVCSGTTQQRLRGSRPLRVADLEINNPGHLSLEQLLAVSGQCSFTTGQVIAPSPSASLLFSGEAASVSGADAARHVRGWCTAEGRSAFTFPVGNGTSFRSLSLSDVQTTSSRVSVRYGGRDNKTVNGTSYMPPMLEVSDNWWTVDAPSNKATVSLPTIDAADAAGATHLGELSVARLSGGSWQLLPSTVTGTLASGTVQAQEVTSFGVLALGRTSATLPVRLLSFGARHKGVGAEVTWKVTGNEDAILYTVQKSGDGRQWTVAGEQMPQQGISEAAYQVFDPAPFSPFTYYRLKTQEANGMVTYSQVVKLDIEGPSRITLRPTLSFGTSPLTLYNTNAEPLEAVVVDASGVVRQRLAIRAGTTSIDVSALPAGAYRVMITHKGEIRERLSFLRL